MGFPWGNFPSLAGILLVFQVGQSTEENPRFSRTSILEVCHSAASPRVCGLCPSKIEFRPNPNGPRSGSCDRAIRYSGFFGVCSVGQTIGDFLDLCRFDDDDWDYRDLPIQKKKHPKCQQNWHSWHRCSKDIHMTRQLRIYVMWCV